LRSSPIIFIVLLLGICIGIQGIAHAQTTNIPLQPIKQWDIFNGPSGVAVDSSGNVYVADSGNNAVEEIYSNGSVKTLGNGYNSQTELYTTYLVGLSHANRDFNMSRGCGYFVYSNATSIVSVNI
jgi:hypothetical protein